MRDSIICRVMTRCASFLSRRALPWLVLTWPGLMGLAGCAPALDWRELRLADTGLSVQFPCKPDSQTRRVPLGPSTLSLELHACTTDAATWAVAFADVGDPARVGPALIELRDALVANLAAPDTQRLELRLDGATPHPASQRVQLSGRLPNDQPVSAQLAVFSKGTRVFRASVVSRRGDAEAMDHFFASLRFTP